MVGTLGYVDDWMLEYYAIEQGAIHQNLGLMCAALGVGGFPHFVAYPFIWCQALGFRMEQVPFSRTIGASAATSAVLRLLKRERPVPTPVGLEHNGEVLIKPYCPPYYRTMEAAVLAFIESKYAPRRGIFRDGGDATAWKDGAAVQEGIPRYSDSTIAATIACCEYSYRRYGRIPPRVGPLRTVTAFQAHRLEEDFYERHYRVDALA